MASRSVFLTFLGTSPYTRCNYVLDDGRRVDGVRYVQEALARLLCAGFGPDDRIVVFLTKEAKEKNWLSGAALDGEPGLKACLDTAGMGDMIQPVDISGGNSTDELWAIFDRVYGVLEQGDRVILDITHAFRFIPMLAMVLLNYARFTRKITIERIYYGAFEVLGPAYKVRDMDLKDRNVPIFDLTDFATLLEWTSGVQELVRHGNPAAVAELLKGASHPRLRAAGSQDATARLWRDTGNCLDQIAGQIMTTRGKEIVAGSAFAHLKERLEECAGITDLPAPFRPLIRDITKKIEPFGRNSVANCLHAARWCAEHGLVQQGLTILQEGVITLMTTRLGLDRKRLKDRELVADVLSVIARKKPLDTCEDLKGERRAIADRIAADPLVTRIAPDYQSLTTARNDINHAGFVAPKKAENFDDTFRKALAAMEDVFQGEGYPAEMAG